MGFRSLALAGCLAAASALALSSGDVRAQDHEGQLVVYASHPSEMVDHFTNLFSQEYGVQVTTIQAGTGELLNRIRAERNRPAADVMWGGFADTGASAPDLFEPYASPELANIQPEMIDETGYNTPFAATIMVIMYNKDLVSEEEAPRTWADLADPKWEGKVVHADPSKSSSSLGALTTWLTIYGKGDEAWQLVEDMTRNQAIVLRSSLVFQQVGRGEYPLGVTYEEAAMNYVLAGTGGIVYPEDGSLLQAEGLFIVKDAPNPNAARLFADFVISEEAQNALAEAFPGRRPTRIGAPTHPAMLSPDQLTIIEYDGQWAAENRDEILQRMEDIIIRTQG